MWFFSFGGAYAQQKASFIDGESHLVLASAHPSPYAARRGFFGNRHFSKANRYLQEHQLDPIQW